MNSSETRAVELELFNHKIRLWQDPNSKHLGSTVWDASMVLAKYLERNASKGEFARKKVQGKRAVELGAGLGLAGMGLALLGCDVVMTDQAEVLPWLRGNVTANMSAAAYAGTSLEGTVGEVKVAELDWGNEQNISAMQPPVDFIIAADVLYAEHLVGALLYTMAALSGPKTQILVSYELRSQSVHAKFLQEAGKHFTIRKVSHAKMDPLYQHDSIDLFLLKKLPKSKLPSEQRDAPEVPLQADGEARASTDVEAGNEAPCRDSCSEGSPEPVVEVASACKEVSSGDEARVSKEAGRLVGTLADGSVCQLSDWEVRRAGVEAARLLAKFNVDTT